MTTRKQTQDTIDMQEQMKEMQKVLTEFVKIFSESSDKLNKIFNEQGVPKTILKMQKDEWETHAGKLGDIMGDTFEDMIVDFNNFGDSMKKMGQDMLGYIAKVILNKGTTKLVDWMFSDKSTGGASNIFKDADEIEGIADTLNSQTGLWTNAKNFLKKIPIFGNFFTKIFGNDSVGINDITDSIDGLKGQTGIWGNILGFFKNIFGNIFGGGSSGFTGNFIDSSQAPYSSDEQTSLWTDIKNFFSKIFGNGGLGGGIFGITKSDGSDKEQTTLWTDIKNFLQNILSFIPRVLGMLGNLIGGLFSLGSNLAGSAISGTVGVGKSLLGSLFGGFKLFHSGGVVPDSASYSLPGTQEQLALLKGGERVLSPGENAQYESSSKPIVVMNNFNVKAWDSKDVSKYLLENRQLLNQITFKGIEDNNCGLRTMVRNV